MLCAIIIELKTNTDKTVNAIYHTTSKHQTEENNGPTWNNNQDKNIKTTNSTLSNYHGIFQPLFWSDPKGFLWVKELNDENKTVQISCKVRAYKSET